MDSNMSVEKEIKDSYSMGVSTGMKLLGDWVSDIINQSAYSKSDGEVIDEIVELLRRYKIYKERE